MILPGNTSSKGPIGLETTQDLERARERLIGRDREALVDFLLSLAGDSGSVGEQVRTFIVGDDVGETVESIQHRIGGCLFRQNMSTGTPLGERSE